METVAKTPHLIKRGSFWYFFRRVPQPLQKQIGKAFIKESLRTSDPMAAKRLCAKREHETNLLFEEAERQLAGLEESRSQQAVNKATLTDRVRQMVFAADEQSSRQWRQLAPFNSEAFRDMRIDAESVLAVLTDPTHVGQDELVGREVHRLTGGLNVEELDQAAWLEVFEVVRRGLIEVYRRKIGRYNSELDREYFDSLFDRARSTGMTVAELEVMFVAEQMRDYDLNNVSMKRRDKVKAMAAVISEILGRDREVASIDDDDVQEVRQMLAQLPANRNKLYPKLGMQAAIERARADGKRPLSPTSQSQYLDVFRAMLSVAGRKGKLTYQPPLKLKPLKRDAVAASAKRDPFTDQQLCTFFHSEFFQRCAPGADNPYLGRDRDWRFWLPLVMLFSGARPNEICQLRVNDIQRTYAGTWFMNLTDEEDKQLKTLSSKRRVPIHSQLIKIGFLEFAADRRLAQPDARLFPTLKPDKYGNLAWYPDKRFNERFLRQVIEVGPRQSLYSLRHNVRDALRRAKAPPETLQAVTGWAEGSGSVSHAYGDPGNPDHHSELSVVRTFGADCGVD